MCCGRAIRRNPSRRKSNERQRGDVNTTKAFEQLFSYGSLHDEAVQVANFGRKLDGEADTLRGHREAKIEIQDRSAVAAAGADYYLNAQYTGNDDDCVAGTVFAVTKQELAQADVYEASADYRRVQVRLQSGTDAWVYVSAASGE